MRREDAKIALVDLPPWDSGILNGEPAYDVFSKFLKSLPRATPLLHNILLENGYSNVHSINPALNKGNKLKRKEEAWIMDSDFLLESVISRTILQNKTLAARFAANNPDRWVILGGPLPTFSADECLEWAPKTVVVRKEGDKTLPILLEHLIKYDSPEGVEGVSYKKNGSPFHEPYREPLSVDELSRLPEPYYNPRDLKRTKVFPIFTSRGCVYDCDFCIVTKLYGEEYRRRSNESIIKTLRSIKDLKTKYVFFYDDNFAALPEETTELLEWMISEKLNKKEYLVQLSTNAAFIDGGKFLDRLREAGVRFAFVGYESMYQESLKKMHKASSVKRNMEAAGRLNKAGIWDHAMMMIDGEIETPESVDYMFQWTKRSVDSVQFFSKIPLPGSEFASKLAEDKILTRKPYLYDAQYVVVRPEHFTPIELQNKMFEMYLDFYSQKVPLNNLFKKAVYYYAKDMAKKIMRAPQTKEYMKELERIS